MRNSYGPKTMGGGTAYGKQDTGDASKVPLMVCREIAVRVFSCKIDKQHGVSTLNVGIKGKHRG